MINYFHNIQNRPETKGQTCDGEFSTFLCGLFLDE